MSTKHTVGALNSYPASGYVHRQCTQWNRQVKRVCVCRCVGSDGGGVGSERKGELFFGTTTLMFSRVEASFRSFSFWIWLHEIDWQ